jgi:hypothetical protein
VGLGQSLLTARLGFVSDHSAQAGAGGSKVVFQFGDALLELFVVDGCLSVLVAQSLVVLSEFVDPVDEVAVGELAELAAELVLEVLAELVPLSS